MRTGYVPPPSSHNGLPPGYRWATVPAALKPTEPGTTAKGVQSPTGRLFVGTGTSRTKAGTAAARQAWDDYSTSGGRGTEP